MMKITQNYLMCVLVAIMLSALFLFSGCDEPSDSAYAPLPRDRQPASVILAFTASWCGPCQRAKPAIAALAAAGVEILVVDIDERPGLARSHGISAVPTFIVLAGDRESARTHDVSELRRLLGGEQ